MRNEQPPSVASVARIVEDLSKNPSAEPALEVSESDLDDFIREWVKRAREVRVTPSAKKAIINSIEEHGDESPWLAVGLVGAGAGIGLAVGIIAKADPAMQAVCALGGAAMALLTLLLWEDRRIEIEFDPASEKFRFVVCPISQ